jgi:hypothetical protein
MTPPHASTPRRKRKPPSPHGLLFGSDALYQVLAQLARTRTVEFTTKTLSRRIRRTPEHTRREIEKLIALGVVSEERRDGKTRVYLVTKSKITDEVLDLPEALIAELGRYRKP